MNEWIDFSVYAAFIVSYWFVFARWASGLGVQMAADRNEEWLAANRSRVAALLRSRWLVGSPWFLWSCYAWGAISLAVLFAGQIGLLPQFLSTMTSGSPPWEVLKNIHSGMLIVGLVYYFGCMVVFMVRLQKDVPLAELRQASLKPRSLDDYVPRWLSRATYALVGVQLGAWVIVGVLGLSSAPDFWTRFIGFATFSAVVIVISRAIVDRRASDLLGVHDRRLGVRFAFGALIYGQVSFARHLFSEIYGPDLEVDRAMHLTLVLALALAILALAHVSQKGPVGLKPGLYDPA